MEMIIEDIPENDFSNSIQQNTNINHNSNKNNSTNKKNKNTNINNNLTNKKNNNPNKNTNINNNSNLNPNPNLNQNINNNLNNQKKFSKKNQIDYDDILRNMGMHEVKGKLFWEQNIATTNENFVSYEPGQRRTRKPIEQQHQQNISSNNSYIYNKYFKNELKENEVSQQPRNIVEYRNMLIKQIIEKKKVEQIKSKQMIFR